MTARLVFLTGSLAGTVYDLPEEDVTFGRQPDRTITFSSNEVFVSAEHATLLFRQGRYVLRDDGSRNGTFVNAERIRERQLQEGDLIQFGAGGPGGRFLVEPAQGVSPTLDPDDLARAQELLQRTRPGADVSTAHATPVSTSTPLTTTRELVTMAVRRGKRTRRALAAVSLSSVVAIASLVIWQQRSKAGLETTLADLASLLATEQASRSALEQEFAAALTQYDSLRNVVEAESRKLADDPRIDRAVIREYSRGVALLVFSYGYAERGGTRWLRYAVDAQGEVVAAPSPGGLVPKITFGGSGPPLRHQGTATGFLIDTSGFLITNRHVAEPWADDEQLALMQSRGLDVIGRFIDLRAFFPPGGQSYPLVVEETSDEADVAVMRALGSGVRSPPLPLASSPGVGPRPGDQLVFIGYPTGVYNLLFRVNQAERGAVLQRAGDDGRKLAEELASQGLIQPLITMGSVSDTTGTEVIHTAATTVGGSGGPLINLRQQVVAVHYASVRSPAPGDPFQTQRGVPIRFAWEILPAAVRRRVAGNK